MINFLQDICCKLKAINKKLFIKTACLYFIITTYSLSAQPGIISEDIKAKDITTNGFTLSFETDVPSAYTLTIFPLLHNGDTITVLSDTIKTTYHEYIFDEAAPSQFFRAFFKIFDNNNDTLYFNKYYATASLSSGAIKVYFNHPVAHAFSHGADAISIGAAMQDTLIAYINRVEETLDIAIYNSYSGSATSGIAGAINNAFNRGVQVRVINQSGTSSLMINYLNPSIPVLSRPAGDFYGLMHHKFAIGDAKHQDADKSWVWTGSTNWTSGQINGPDRNNVIIVYDQTLTITYTIEFEEMWGGSNLLPDTALSRFGNDKLDDTPKEFNIGGVEVRCYFSPSDNTEQQILELINNAQQNIAVVTMLITRYGIANALINKYNSGVENFAILLDSQNPLGSQKPYLMDNLPQGRILNFTAYGIMHHKYMVVDDGHPQAAVLTGSHNWSAAAQTRNDENTLIIFDADIANQYYQGAAYLYDEVGGSINTINHYDKEPQYLIFPNPADGYFYVKAFTDGGIKIAIYDLQGRSIKEMYIPDNSNTISIKVCTKDIAEGIYLVRLISKNKSLSQKILISR